MMSTGYAAYNQAAINTVQSKEKILLMLYDGAIRFVRFAGTGIAENNIESKGEYISRVLAILAELECALDRKAGGELAENLAMLYRYMTGRLTHANVHNDPDALVEVERLLTRLKEGFEGAMQENREELRVQAPAHPAEAVKGISCAV